MNLIDRNHHGAVEINGIENAAEYHDGVHYDKAVHLGDKALIKVTRLRMITDRDFPMWDVSYCHGTIKHTDENGKIKMITVPVHLPVTQFNKRSVKGDIIAMAKQAGVFAKGLGLLDEFSVWSRVYP